MQRAAMAAKIRRYGLLFIFCRLKLYEVKGRCLYEVKGGGSYEVKGDGFYEVKGDGFYEVKGFTGSFGRATRHRRSSDTTVHKDRWGSSLNSSRWCRR